MEIMGIRKKGISKKYIMLRYIDTGVIVRKGYSGDRNDSERSKKSKTLSPL